MLLYYLGDYSQAAIAEFLGVTANAVKTRLYSARKRMKKHMQQIEENLQAARPSNQPDFARRVISATLQLQLGYLDDYGRKQRTGSTIASRTANIPQAETWLIEPRQTLTEKDWETVLGLLKELRIPGLSVEGQISDEWLERLSQLDHLIYLEIPGSARVTDEGLQQLARLPRLQYMDVSCPAITDRGLEVLRHLPQLKTFKLVHQGCVTDAGLAHLAHCPQLECVNLMGTRSGDGVIQALAGKPKLRELFAGSEVTDAGLALLHEFPVFKQGLGSTAAMSSMSADMRPNFLWLNLTSPLTNAGIANLAGLDGLAALSFFGGKAGTPFDSSGSAVTPDGLWPLANLPNLSWLGCTNELCTDEAMRHISALPRLRFLMCQDTVAGDAGFTALSRSSSLESIWGRRCYNLTGRGFAALAALPLLRELSVSCKNVAEDGLAALPHFPALKEFMPMDVPDEGFRHVGRCTQLEALRCMYCVETTDAATQHLAGLSRLRTYEAWSTRITDRSLELLAHISSLERILISYCEEITNDGLAALARLPRLREVVLEGLPLTTPEGAAVFPVHVQVNIVTE